MSPALTVLGTLRAGRLVSHREFFGPSLGDLSFRLSRNRKTTIAGARNITNIESRDLWGFKKPHGIAQRAPARNPASSDRRATVVYLRLARGQSKRQSPTRVERRRLQKMLFQRPASPQSHFLAANMPLTPPQGRVGLRAQTSLWTRVLRSPRWLRRKTI